MDLGWLGDDAVFEGLQYLLDELQRGLVDDGHVDLDSVQGGLRFDGFIFVEIGIEAKVCFKEGHGVVHALTLDSEIADDVLNHALSPRDELDDGELFLD